jgi:hypothetical protein
MILLKWMVVPRAVLAIAFWFALAEWFESTWIAIGYCIVAIPAILLWRRATYRLVPSARNVHVHELDDRRMRKLRTRFILTLGISLAFMIGVLLTLIFVPSTRTASGSFFAFTMIVWASLVKFGAFNVLAHEVLKGASHTTTFPQRPCV